MKGKLNIVKGFLESQNITWQEDILYDYEKKKPRIAKDKDFDGVRIFTIPVTTQKSSTVAKLVSILATDEMFLIFDKDRTEMKADFSFAWKAYQKDIQHKASTENIDEEVEEKLNNLREYLKEDIDE